jgi:hypothetical protein
VALVYVGGGFFCTIGEQLTAPGLAVEQLAKDAGDFAFTATRIEPPRVPVGSGMNQEAVASAM